MRLATRVTLTSAAVLVPMAMGLAAVDALSRRRVSRAELLQVGRSAVAFPGERAACEAQPEQWGDHPRGMPAVEPPSRFFGLGEPAKPSGASAPGKRSPAGPPRSLPPTFDGSGPPGGPPKSGTYVGHIDPPTIHIYRSDGTPTRDGDRS